MVIGSFIHYQRLIELSERQVMHVSSIIVSLRKIILLVKTRYMIKIANSLSNINPTLKKSADFTVLFNYLIIIILFYYLVYLIQ